MEWRRVDLHIHTPASKDYQESQATYLDILQKAEAEGLDIIAFTDHNSIAGYAAMKQEISDLERWEADGRIRPAEKARLEEYQRLLDKILVLPGAEFTATFGFHILAIFDENTEIRAIEHTLLKLNVPSELLDAGETEVGPTCDVLTAYNVMHDAGALIIAAHANSSHGVAMFGVGIGGQTRIAYTQDPNLHALEVTDLESRRRRTTASFFSGSKPEYPRRMHCIQGSDAHRITGQGKNLGVGERATEVLLPEASFEALKALFSSSDFARTRPYRHAAEPFDYIQAARKEGATIVQSFHEGMSRLGGRLHSIMRDIVAFANTNGGTIYVGVSSSVKAPPRGIDKPEEAMKQLHLMTERLITPPIAVTFSVSKSQGKDIIRIVVPKGDAPPYVLEGSKIYIRKESETGLALRDEIVALVKRIVRVQEPSGPPAEKKVKAEAPAKTDQKREQPRGFGAEPPRTGVEITNTVERNGVLYHTMRDLRDRGEVQNVSRASARRLWRYAIALKEKGTFEQGKVKWSGDLGLWHKYFRAGRPRYDLVQKDTDGETHVYYGVTEDGINGAWRAVVGLED